MTSPTPTAARSGLLTRNHTIGLALATLLAMADLATPLVPHPEGEGPPPVVDWTVAILGLVTLLGVLWAVRAASTGARWLVAASRAFSAVLALPVFFVGVPVALQAVVVVLVALTAASVALVLSPPRPEVLR